MADENHRTLSRPVKRRAAEQVAQHTPGPWIVEADYGSPSKTLVYAGERNIADCMTGDRAQDEANARLMAAAPDMLADLDRVIAWLHRLATASDAQEKGNRGRFNSLADACKAGAKNYRDTAARLSKTTAKARGGSQ